MNGAAINVSNVTDNKNMEIRINNLIKQYGKNTVLDIPELTVQQGELVGLVGNNGAGKTTLMRLMLDLIEATEGTVELGHCSVSEDPAWKQTTGSFIDGRFLIDFYTPEEYFAFIAQTYGLSKDTLDSRLAEYHMLMHDEILGTKKYLRQFSEGNRQKIGIIGAMMINPQLLILDEPFNYLDPTSQITVARLIRQMNEQQGTTVIISSHNLNFVSEISSRILLLEKGVVIKDLPNHDGSATKELEDYFTTAEQ
jgi:ABC-2 type transport system ATP-binding protein